MTESYTKISESPTVKMETASMVIEEVDHVDSGYVVLANSYDEHEWIPWTVEAKQDRIGNPPERYGWFVQKDVVDSIHDPDIRKRNYEVGEV